MQGSSGGLERALRQIAEAVARLADRIQNLERAERKQPEFRAVSKSADYTPTLRNLVIFMSASGGARVVTLPVAATSKGWGFYIIKTDATTNTVTVDGNGSETISGNLTYVIGAQYQGVHVWCDGAAWYATGMATPFEAIFTVEGTLSVQTGTIRLYNQMRRTGTAIEVFLAADTAPTGADIIIDIHKNGTTIFTNQANRPRIVAGANTGTTVTIDVPAWADGDYWTMDIDQVGSGVAGSDLSVHAVYR